MINELAQHGEVAEMHFLLRNTDGQEDKADGDDRRHPAAQAVQAVHQVGRVAAKNDQQQGQHAAADEGGPVDERRRQVHPQPQVQACHDVVHEGVRHVRPDARRQQQRPGRELAGDFHAGRDVFDVIPQAQQHHHECRRQHAGRHVHVVVQARHQVMDRHQPRHRQPGEPPQEHRHAPQVRHRLGVQFSHQVRLVDDVVVDRHRSHDRREDERHQE